MVWLLFSSYSGTIGTYIPRFCFQVGTSFVPFIALFGKATTAPTRESGNRKRCRFFTQVFLAHNSKLRYNEDAEGSCQSESEAKICTVTLTGTR